MNSPEEGAQLQPGKILVAVTTNVGWTPIFPRAAAVVTDVGAPLPHATIVARELGIPAVVGCFNATKLLRTGDRVRVDGARGIVEILDSCCFEERYVSRKSQASVDGRNDRHDVVACAHWTPTELWMLLIARVLSGLLASAMLPTTMAYIGDSIPDEERGGGIGQLGAAAGLGIILEPGIGGWLAGDSLVLPFFIAAGLSLVSLILIALLLPESLSIEARKRQGKVGLDDVGELWRALFSPIGILLFIAFVVSFGAINFQAIFGLYALASTRISLDNTIALQAQQFGYAVIVWLERSEFNKTVFGISPRNYPVSHSLIL